MQHVEPHSPGRARFGRRAALAGLAAVMLTHTMPGHPAAAAQNSLPQPPCGTAPFPPYPVGGVPGSAPAIARSWQAGAELPRWTPPACTGWSAGSGQGFRVLVALAGRITLAPGSRMEELLGRFAAVSRLAAVRYWSTSDGEWRPLVTSAAALAGPDPARRRADFSVPELLSGQDVYFVQHDSRSSGEVVYRMRVLDSGPDRLVVQTENVTPIRLLLVTLFQPRALQAVHFFTRLSPTSWGYYGLSRTTEEGSSTLAGGHAASYVNRAAALFRLAADVPTDRDPPMAR